MNTDLEVSRIESARDHTEQRVGIHVAGVW